MTHLYRHYSKDGDLLYVGISTSAVARLAQHKNTSHWFREIGTITVENFDNRDEALAAEKFAIKKEKPLFNKQGAILDNTSNNQKKNRYVATLSEKDKVQSRSFRPDFNVCGCEDSIENIKEYEAVSDQVVYCCFNDEVAAFSFFCDYCGNEDVISKNLADGSGELLDMGNDPKKYVLEKINDTKWNSYELGFAKVKYPVKSIKKSKFELEDYLPWWMYET